VYIRRQDITGHARVADQDGAHADGDPIAAGRENPQEGRPVRVPLEKLVEKVFVSPGAPAWYVDVVRKVLIRYGYAWPVVTSGLDARPLY